MPLPPVQKNDQVFQLSLTELAFTIIFLLLLLAGLILVKVSNARDRAQEELANSEELLEKVELERQEAAKVLEEIRTVLVESGVANPDDVISELQEKISQAAEREILRKQVEDLNAKLTSLTEFEKMLQEVSPKEEKDQAKEFVESALKFKAMVEENLGEEVEEGREAEKAKELAEALAQMQELGEDPETVLELAKEGKYLREQLAWHKRKLEARGGRDYPPCWADEATGKVQYLFKIDIREEGLALEPAWPPEREEEARALPGIETLLGEEVQALGSFRGRMKEIDAECREKNCRHYVILSNQVKDLDVFNKHRYGVEGHFYKYEERR